MTFTIDKNIPFPRMRGKYPLHNMEIGDSFLVNDGRSMKSVSGAIFVAARRAGISIACRTVPEGIRVWRIK